MMIILPYLIAFLEVLFVGVRVAIVTVNIGLRDAATNPQTSCAILNESISDPAL
jgi:hypothetical protein